MAKSKKNVLFQASYKNKETFKGGAADIFFERDNVKKFAHLHQLISEKYIEWLLPHTKNISTILEIGCGTGHRLNSLCSQLEAKGIGIDPGKKAVDFINQKYNHIISAKVGFGDHLEVDDYSVDVCLMGFFLYLVDRSLFLRCVSEADRVLKNGGFLLIVDFDPFLQYFNKHRYHKKVKSYKFDNTKPFLNSGLYYLCHKHSFSHWSFSFNLDENERCSMTMLYKEITPFGVVPSN